MGGGGSTLLVMSCYQLGTVCMSSWKLLKLCIYVYFSLRYTLSHLLWPASPDYWITRVSCPKSSEYTLVTYLRRLKTIEDRAMTREPQTCVHFPDDPGQILSTLSAPCTASKWCSGADVPLVLTSDIRGFIGIRDQWVIQHFLNLPVNPGRPLLIKQLWNGCKSLLSGSQLSHHGETLSLILSHEPHIMKDDAVF